MDARAFRLEWPSAFRLFEVDRADIFERKESVLVRLNATPACDRRIVRADLAQPWTNTLIAAGFDPRRPTAFLVEGLSMYLDEAGVTQLLDALGTIAVSGSWLGMDFVNTHTLTSPYTAAYMKKLAEAGCAWHFGVDDPRDLLGRHGWRATIASAGDPGANYGRWPYPPMSAAVPKLPRSFFATAFRTSGESSAAS